MKGSEVIKYIVKSIIPEMGYSLHKGSMGRICVFGGSEEYTGAPYYSAISSLRIGCDLSTVVCTPSASIPIKSYSPELIVYPYLGDTLSSRFSGERNNVFVVGPGLGRSDNNVLNGVMDFSFAEKHVVFDGDGIFLLCSFPFEKISKCLENSFSCVITPNANEFIRLKSRFLPDYTSRESPDDSKETMDLCKEIGKKLGGKINVVLVRKGFRDIITDGKLSISVGINNPSPRRCGGQGDVLSGSLGTFLFWAGLATKKSVFPWIGGDIVSNVLMSCVGACLVVKKSSSLAFCKKKRGTVTPDIIECIVDAFDFTFSEKNNEDDFEELIQFN